jgi:hypothetical protein
LNNSTHVSPDKRAMSYGSSGAILDHDTVTHLKNYKPDYYKVMYDSLIVDEFCQQYRDWIINTSFNKYIGIESFKYCAYSNGTSESFDKFYIKNNKRRFRCFKGEYVYHQVTWRNAWPNWAFLEDDALNENDAVVISYPFSDTGTKHSLHDKILKECVRLNIPVLIDCVFAGAAYDLEFDFSYPCITDIVFSLSKIFPVAYARIGMRLTRNDDDDSLFVYQKISYNNRLSADLGLHFINKYSVDYIVKKYQNTQMEFCKQLDVCPSNTVSFGLGDERWQEYNRGSITNRLSFHKFLHLGVLDGS